MVIFGIYSLIGVVLFFYIYFNHEEEFIDELKKRSLFVDIKILLIFAMIICILLWPYLVFSAFVDKDDDDK